MFTFGSSGRYVALVSVVAALAWILSFVAALVLPIEPTEKPCQAGRWSRFFSSAPLVVLFPVSLFLLSTPFVHSRLVFVALFFISVTPISFFEIRRSLNGAPPNLEDAAQIEGASRFQIFRHAVLPVVLGSLIMSALFIVIAAASFLIFFPLVFLAVRF